MSSTPKRVAETRTGQALWVALLCLCSLISYKLGQRVERSSLETRDDLAPVQTGVTQNSSYEHSPLTTTQKLNSAMSISHSSDVECPPPICPPCECAPEPTPKKRERRRPPRPKETSPADRRRLLAWVKRYSPRLKRCRDAGQPIYRLNAQVTLNTKRDQVLKVKVNGRDVPIAAMRCVESDIKRWPAPVGLAANHPQKLIFSLQLN